VKDGNAILFNEDWKFILGDPEDAACPDYPDRTWQRLDLPHDWVISQPFKRGEEAGWTSQNMQGFFAWQGVCWYRKFFAIPDTARKAVSLYFGGAYRNCVVFINGQEAGRRSYGYSSFELDITRFLNKAGEQNCVAVRLDNTSEPPDRWYSGSGLFRNVYLRVVPLIHIKTWGVCVTSALTWGADGRLSVETTVVNLSHAPAEGRVCVTVLVPDTAPTAESSAPFRAAGQAELSVQQRLLIKEPRLWDAEQPNLYRVLVHLEDERGAAIGKPVETRVGIRAIELRAHEGMRINGKEGEKLRGVCLHHDCGILGAAYYDEAWRRRLLTLKRIGCNAIRTSHNPPAEEFLDLCDELGFYVIDECFDKWKSGSYGKLFDENWRRDLEDFIRRDRNHPSVFLWSVGNEVEGQGTDEMLRIQRMLVSRIRELDSRPVTCALEPHAHPRSLTTAPISELVALTQKLAADVDVLGLNYHEPLYQYYTAAIDKPIIGTECYEYYSSTGSEFEDVVSKNPWRYVLESDNVLGQFIWAGIDYLGESSYPAKGWAGSILDICGFLKPNAYYRQSIWTGKPMVYLTFYDNSLKPDYVRGRWSFPQSASHLNFGHFQHKTVSAAIYTNCDEVELWINGKNRGRRKPADFENRIIEWSFEYASGEVRTVGYNGGQAVAEYALKTAGAPRLIRLEPDTLTLKPGGLAHIELSVTDESGLLCPTEETLLEFALRGDGLIMGACSPDITNDLGYTLPKTKTFRGKALVIVKAGASPGNLTLSVYAGPLQPAECVFTVA
jgi:beta-galactosidase